MPRPKSRTVHPSPPESVMHGAAYWTGDDFQVREKDGVISVLPHGLDASFTVTRDDNYRLVGALASALAWAEERDSGE